MGMQNTCQARIHVDSHMAVVLPADTAAVTSLDEVGSVARMVANRVLVDARCPDQTGTACERGHRALSPQRTRGPAATLVCLDALDGLQSA